MKKNGTRRRCTGRKIMRSIKKGSARLLIGVSRQALPARDSPSKKGTFACPNYSVSKPLQEEII
jgi:hypothetical protein